MMGRIRESNTNGDVSMAKRYKREIRTKKPKAPKPTIDEQPFDELPAYAPLKVITKV